MNAYWIFFLIFTYIVDAKMKFALKINGAELTKTDSVIINITKMFDTTALIIV